MFLWFCCPRPTKCSSLLEETTSLPLSIYFGLSNYFRPCTRNVSAWLFRTRQVCWLREHQRQCTSRKEKLKVGAVGISVAMRDRSNTLVTYWPTIKTMDMHWFLGSRPKRTLPRSSKRGIQLISNIVNAPLWGFKDGASLVSSALTSEFRCKILPYPRKTDSLLNVCSSNSSNIHDVYLISHITYITYQLDISLQTLKYL